tara:strand:+ start:489 stop:743 length:255 start_codon:yes stop_codon:yes gene_type:complete
MTEKQINKMVDKLAESMIKRIYGVNNDEARKDMSYFAEKEEDHVVGELARLMTLMNIYEEREEYEKCAAVKKHLDKVNETLENL